MSWGTKFNTEIIILGKHFESHQQLEYHIKEVEDAINDIKHNLMLISNTPVRDQFPLSRFPLTEWKNAYKDTISDLEDLISERDRCNLLLNYLAENPQTDLSELKFE